MTLAARKNEIDETAPGGLMAKALADMAGFMAKSGEAWAPSMSDVPDNATKHREPSVAKRGKASVSMGGSPQAKRAVPADENGGGYDELDEPEDGEKRIRAARNKGKGTVPKTPGASNFKSFAGVELDEDGVPLSIYKGFQPGADEDYEDDGPAEAEGDAEDAEYGDEDAPPGPSEDGDEQMDPQLQQLVMALQQNPQLLEALMQALSGAGAASDGGAPMGGPPAPPMGGGGAPPPAAGAPAGAPPPQMGPPPAEDPRVMQRSLQYVDVMEKAMANDPNADALADAMDVSPVLEALANHMITSAGETLARLDAVLEIVEAQTQKSMAAEKRLARMEKALGVALPVLELLGKSFAAAESEPVRKSVSAKPPTQFPSAGVMIPDAIRKAAGGSVTREGKANKSVLTDVLVKSMTDGDAEAAEMLKFVDSPFTGPQHVLETMGASLFEKYQAAVAQASR